MAKTLVIYYSRRGQNYFNGEIKDIPKGNTEFVAEYIQQAVGADLFEVKTKKQYAADYTKCTEEAKRDLQMQARPALIQKLDSVDTYDNIVIAGPCWWGTYPMAIFTQLEALNFSGKKVFPLMTHEGSGLSGAPAALRKFCNSATVGMGLAIRGADAAESEAKVAKWAKNSL